MALGGCPLTAELRLRSYAYCKLCWDTEDKEGRRGVSFGLPGELPQGCRAIIRGRGQLRVKFQAFPADRSGIPWL